MNPFGVIGLVIGITNIAIGLLVYAYDRKSRNNQLWSLFAVSVAIWGFGSYIISITDDSASALMWWKLTHVGVILIPFSFLVFAYSFLEIKNRFVSWFSVIISAFFIYLTFTSQLIVSVRKVFDSFYYDGPPTPLYSFFVACFVLTILYTLIISFKVYYECKDPIRKRQILFFMLASAIGSAGGSTSFFPVYGIYVYPYLNASIILFPFIIGYAILRHGLFNLKAIATELFVFTIWIFILLRAMLGTNTEDIVLDLSLLVVMIFIGILLIRSVRKEISARERIEALAADLEKSNENQVALIHFITHQVKGFFTKSRDIFSLLMEGDAGNIPDKAKEFVRQGFDSDTKGVAMVQDVLTATNVRSGIMKYAMEPFDLQPLIATLVGEYKSMAEGKGLTLTYEAQGAGTHGKVSAYTIAGDQGQLKNVFKNLIENSIKYTPSGTVDVSLARKDMPGDAAGGKNAGTGANSTSKIIFAVKDTGVGITPEDKRMLFTQGGRGKDSVKINVESTGYGLYIAKGIVEAHHGTIRAESAGPGKGSQFYVELPAVG